MIWMSRSMINGSMVQNIFRSFLTLSYIHTHSYQKQAMFILCMDSINKIHWTLNWTKCTWAVNIPGYNAKVSTVCIGNLLVAFSTNQMGKILYHPHYSTCHMAKNYLKYSMYVTYTLCVILNILKIISSFFLKTSPFHIPPVHTTWTNALQR